VIRTLFIEKKWDAILQLAPEAEHYPPDLDYYRGMALASSEQWQEAERSFRKGQIKAPNDKRFPLELAGIAFKQGNRSEARTLVRQVLRLDPGDSYANDFLATLYFLSGNVEAALKYWNRIGKPDIEEIRSDPQPRVNPVLLDRAFAAAPASLLRLDDFLRTRDRIGFLEIFSPYRLELDPRRDGKFDLIFRPHERHGWGSTMTERMLHLGRGIPYQTLHLEAFNLKRSAVNSISLIRWDAEKRRAFTSLSGPLGEDPKWRVRIHLDGRRENWDLSRSSLEVALPVNEFNLQKLEAGASLGSMTNGRWEWSSAVEVSHRQFMNPPEPSTLFAEGLALKYRLQINRQILAIPERRFTMAPFAAVEIAKIFAGSGNPYSRIQGGLDWSWHPRAQGNDYLMTGRFRAGKIAGQPPFDELFNLGLDHDQDFWFRGHAGTRNGKKGSGPLGHDYLLMNFEFDKEIYKNGIWRLSSGPFLDTGRVYNRRTSFGFENWLCDAGIQAKVRILGALTVVFFYGRDLRSGRNTFYFDTINR
jgi:Tetratricopeptide repeat